MPRINWRVRLRSGQFWLGVVGALGSCALSLADALGLGACASPWVGAIQGTATSALTVLALVGVVSDPTTQGLGDSEQALQYKVPKPTGTTKSTTKGA